MKVTFVLPGFKAKPAGGFLVVYRYANELTRRGHQVRVIHPRRVKRAVTAVERLKAATWRYRKSLRHPGGRPSWFELDRRVDVIMASDLRQSRVPDGDVIFATACTTVPAVWSYSDRAGRKLYLIQHFEDWLCGRDQVESTWRLPMHKVVVSRWLYDIGVSLGERARLTHIPNGVELETFRVLTPLQERSGLRIGILAHTTKFKGLAHGIAALEIIRARIPTIEAVFFGVDSRPHDLPDWAQYVENPSRSDLAYLYNSFALFIHTSEAEGWGLPGAEALACGCALVAADSGGVRDYAVDGGTALVVPPGDPDALAAAAIRLIEDSAFRLQLAHAGSSAIQAFTWNRAAESLDAVLRETRDPSPQSLGVPVPSTS